MRFLPALGTLGILLFSAWAQAAEERPPNIVFILIDDMGWTDLGIQGSDLYETPHIDGLAKRGMRFTNAYSACTVCSPTRAAVMTGRYPARLHITDWIHGTQAPKAKLAIPDWTQYLPLEETTIAEVLHARGYATASIGKWHLGDEPEYFPDRQGFDLNVAGCGRGQPPSYFSPYGIATIQDGAKGEYLTDRLTDEACRFITEHREQPFLLYLPHYCVHTPLQAKPALVEHYQSKASAGLRHQNAKYAAMIKSLDESVGRILATLEEAGIAQRTIVFFTSDNGGLLQSTSNVPLRAGKGSSYEGGVRVPLAIHWPGVTRPGSTSSEPVISVDYFPTILEMTATTRSAATSTIDGTSLAPVLQNADAKLAREEIYWHYPHYHPGGATPYGAVRARDWKLIEFYEDQHVELYNLADDLSETHDLASQMPEKAGELRTRLAAWRSDVGAQMPTPNPQYDPSAPLFPKRTPKRVQP
jgi:arylsulfatase A